MLNDLIQWILFLLDSGDVEPTQQMGGGSDPLG